MTSRERDSEATAAALPNLRFEVSEAARILRISRALLYNRIHEGSLRPQKDGARTYITQAELERYVESCNSPPERDHTQEAPRRSGRHTGIRANGRWQT
jgi:excisionase family DNA binding protein